MKQGGDIGTVLTKAPEESVEAGFPNADETLNSIPSVEEPVKRAEEIEANPDLHVHGTPNLIPSAEEPAHAAAPPATELIKAPDARPRPRFSEMPKLLPSGAEQT